ncbi:MAG: sulfatase, partial [Pigmentiphaga sp.]
LPASFAPPAEGAPPPLRHLLAERDQGRSDRDSWLPQAVSEKDVREAIALTYGSITMIDDAVGRVLATLDELGLRENTVVIFTSDHGDFMGDHQLMFKGPLHYDGLIRVPFIWSDPTRADRAGAVETLGGTLDIARTVLARAGMAPFNGMQGRDLLAPANDDQQPRDAMLVEEDNQRSFLGFDRPVRLRTLVTNRWRLSVYRGVDWGELYDLDNDPQERHNLWDVPELRETRGELLWKMVQTMEELADDSPLPRARA